MKMVLGEPLVLPGQLTTAEGLAPLPVRSYRETLVTPLPHSIPTWPLPPAGGS